MGLVLQKTGITYIKGSVINALDQLNGAFTFVFPANPTGIVRYWNVHANAVLFAPSFATSTGTGYRGTYTGTTTGTSGSDTVWSLNAFLGAQLGGGNAALAGALLPNPLGEYYEQIDQASIFPLYSAGQSIKIDVRQLVGQISGFNLSAPIAQGTIAHVQATYYRQVNYPN